MALKPTVLVIGYGMNESFEGEAGLSTFKQDFKRLLDALAPAKARLVFLSPIKHQNLGPPLPDPSKHNQAIALYVEAIRSIAQERKDRFVDLFHAPELDALAFRPTAFT